MSKMLPLPVLNVYFTDSTVSGSARMASVEDMRIEGTLREAKHTAV